MGLLIQHGSKPAQQTATIQQIFILPLCRDINLSYFTLFLFTAKQLIVKITEPLCSDPKGPSIPSLWHKVHLEMRPWGVASHLTCDKKQLQAQQACFWAPKWLLCTFLAFGIQPVWWAVIWEPSNSLSSTFLFFLPFIGSGPEEKCLTSGIV